MFSSKSFSKPACRLPIVVFVFLVFAVIPAIATVHNVYEGESIQAAIDAASSGDTIIVHTGTYTENVDITKKLTVMGVDSPLVQAADSSDHVFRVTADSVNISGFRVEGATTSGKAGTYFLNADYCNIHSSNIYNNYYGIQLRSSSNNIIANNIIRNNSKHGIYLSHSGTSENQIIGNDIFGNTAGGSGIHLTPAASNNVIHFNNIVGNSPEGSGSYGVYNDNTSETVDATLNYWGDASGPTHSGNPSGTGDAISDYVEYDPWFADTVSNESTTAGTDTIDAKSTANTEVIKEGVGTPTISVAQYHSNPGGAHTFTAFAGGYIDVHINDTSSVNSITIRLYYPITVSPEVGLAFYWWDGANWVLCSQQGINTTDIPPNYGGYIEARITDNTTPSLADLLGAPLGGGSTPVVPFYPPIAFIIFAVLIAVATIVYLKRVKCRV